MDDESISSSDRAEKWFERTRFCSAFFSLSEATGLGGTWGLLEGVEHLGCENPTMSARTPSILTLVEVLNNDKSSFEVMVFKGPAEPLGVLLEGAAEPLDAIFWGLAEPLEAVLGGSAEPPSVSEEHPVDSHGTWASADTILDFPEEAQVLVDTDPGLPDECTLDSVILSGWSENTQVNEVWHWTDLDSLLVEVATAQVLPPETTVGILASTNCLASRKDTHFSTRTRWISLSLRQTGQSPADEAWGPLQLEHSLGPSHWPSCPSFPQPVHLAATLQRWLACPNLLQLKQRIGLGTNKATFTFRQPTVISFGSSREPNVKKRVLVGITLPFLLSVTQFTPTTPWSFSSSRISNLRHVSEVPTSDHSRRGAQGLVNWDLDWSVNKSVCSE